VSGLTRAEFLRAASALTLAWSLPAHAALPDDPVDVVVVGAGLAGLATARALVAAGVSVRVLEARDRVGGRTVNLSLEGGHVVEGGGEWIGPTQTRVAELAAEVGVGTFPAYYGGATTYDILGRVSRGLLPDVSLAEQGHALRLLWALDRLAKTVPRGAAWESPDAARLDALTVHDWLVSQGASPYAHSVFTLITRAVLAGYPERISLLWLLHYVSASGSLLQIILNDGGAQDLRFVGGSQAVSIRLAEALGEVVQLGCPVSDIVDAADGLVAVHTARGVVRAHRAVVAMMPADMLRIRFRPGLPPLRHDLVTGWARLTRLPLIKASLVYDRPFWRDAGLSGAMQSDTGPVQLVFDNSPEDGSIGVLTCFLSITEAPHLADARHRESGLVDLLVRYFGPGAGTPRGYAEKDWATDPWSSGCLTPLPPGLLSRCGPALRAPVGRVHWAGTETARVWCGYMDGAVRSGDRAAAEVLAALGR
jgi:monoamine oxidase